MTIGLVLSKGEKEDDSRIEKPLYFGTCSYCAPSPRRTRL
jgi:hypothetical protein